METALKQPELPNIVGILGEKFHGSPLAGFLQHWEYIAFSLFVALVIIIFSYIATRKMSLVPSGTQNLIEAIAASIDGFICGILGPKGRKFTPFIGTLFIYILFMNLLGLVPFMKSATADWSITLALALCVFIYVQYTAFKELGFLGYFDHLMGKPRGALAFSIIIPVFMLAVHLVTEMIKPITLSLRLRSNVWGDDILLAMLAGFGIKGLPLLIFNMLLAVLTAVVQATVFALLSTIYFALVMPEEEH